MLPTALILPLAVKLAALTLTSPLAVGILTLLVPLEIELPLPPPPNVTGVPLA
jgi:hypothetical protein